jgi:hypothetical protein
MANILLRRIFRPMLQEHEHSMGTPRERDQEWKGEGGKVDVSAHVGISLPALLASVCLMLVRDQNASDFCNVNFSGLLLSAKKNIPLYCLARIKKITQILG